MLLLLVKSVPLGKNKPVRESCVKIYVDIYVKQSKVIAMTIKAAFP